MEDKTEIEYIESQLPENVQKLRKRIFDYKKPTVDQYGDGFLAQAYLSAYNSKSGTDSSISKSLGLDRMTFNYYMETYPDFVMAIHMGKLDANNERVSNLKNVLLSRAYGMEVEETKREESGVIDEDGNVVQPFVKTTTIKKQIPPDTNAILAILQRIDPRWEQKSTVNVNFNENLNVTEDVNINIDLRELSPSALKEIMGSMKKACNGNINRTPDGTPVYKINSEGNTREVTEKEDKEDESPPKKRRRKKSETNSNVKVVKKQLTEEKLSELTNKVGEENAEIS